MHTHSQFLMPGLVDCHLHPAQYSTAGVVAETLVDQLLNTYVPAELAFRNTTFAREQSMTLVVSRLYTITVMYFYAFKKWLIPNYNSAQLKS